MLTGLPCEQTLTMKLVWRHQERGRLHDVDDARDFRERRVLVNVGEHGHADLVLHALQHLEAGVDAGAAEALGGGAVRLVVRRLEDERHAEAGRDVLERAGDFLREGLAFDDAGTGDEKHRPVDADLKIGE